MKQVCKNGFILLELLLTVSIAGILGAALLVALSQAISIQKKVDEKISLYTRFALVQNQMERDLMGVFIPMQVAQIKKNVSLPFGIATTKEVMSTDVPEPLQDIFSAKGSAELFQSLSFVSNNSMQLFWSETAGKARPRAVRIAYHLVEDEQAGGYRLIRQEGSDLSPAAYTTIQDQQTGMQENKGGVRAYTLITGIRSMAVTYLGRATKKAEAPAQEKKEEGATKDAEPKDDQKKPEFTKVNSWGKENKDLPMIPEYVEVGIVLFDKRYKQELNMTFIIEIPSELQVPSTQQPFLDDLEQQEQEKKDEPKKADDKTKDVKKPDESKKEESSKTVEVTVITQETIETTGGRPVSRVSRSHRVNKVIEVPS